MIWALCTLRFRPDNVLKHMYLRIVKCSPHNSFRGFICILKFMLKYFVLAEGYMRMECPTHSLLSQLNNHHIRPLPPPIDWASKQELSADWLLPDTWLHSQTSLHYVFSFLSTHILMFTVSAQRSGRFPYWIFVIAHPRLNCLWTEGNGKGPISFHWRRTGPPSQSLCMKYISPYFPPCPLSPPVWN